MCRLINLVLVLVLAVAAAPLMAQEDVEVCSPADVVSHVEEAMELYRIDQEMTATDVPSALGSVKYLRDLLAQIPFMCGVDSDMADLVLYVWEETDYEGNPRLRLSAQSSLSLDVLKFELDVFVFHGRQSEEYCNSSILWTGDPPLELSCGDARVRLEDVTAITASISHGSGQHFRCAKIASNPNEDVYTCTER